MGLCVNIYKRIPKMTRTNPDHQFWQEADRIPGYPLGEKLHGWFYLRFPYLYIATATGSNALGKFGAAAIGFFQRVFPLRPPRAGQITFADTYHGKVVPLKTARQLVSVKQDIRVENLEKVIPYKLARSLILDHPDHLAAMDCPCRVARENPCLPLDVCLIVGEPFASLVLSHHPERSRSITSQEAIAILEAEEERGHVHHAFFKEAVLDRFYAICNCCGCCCGAMQAHQHGTPMLASSGYIAQVDEDLCIGCAECNAFCQFGAISVLDGVNHVDTTRCMGCGICTSHCPYDAIELVLAPEKGIPLEMDKILGTIG
jgi:Pyruvate/2-oxoacid:ferredoxin oxidoreductase delta subunit